MLKINKQQNPVWILCTPRSGSTYLSKIMNSTKNFNPPFAEYLGWKKNLFMNPESLKENPPVFCKALHVHLNRIFFDPSYLKDVEHNNYLQTKKPPLEAKTILEKSLPNLRFVWLKREDVIGQTVSYCIASEASKTKSFFNMDSKKKQQEFLDMPLCITDELLLSFYKTVLKYNDIWMDFIGSSDVFFIKYEEINQSSLKELFNFLELPKENLTEALCIAQKESLKSAVLRKDFCLLSDRLKQII